MVIKNILFATCIFPLFLIVEIVTYNVNVIWNGMTDANVNSETDFYKLGLLTALTFVGIIFGNIYQHIEKNSSKGDFVSVKEFKEMLASRNLWRSLVASPIVCGVVISTVSESHNMLLSLVFAFENGFFWNHVLSKRLKSNS